MPHSEWMNQLANRQALSCENSILTQADSSWCRLSSAANSQAAWFDLCADYNNSATTQQFKIHWSQGTAISTSDQWYQPYTALTNADWGATWGRYCMGQQQPSGINILVPQREYRGAWETPVATPLVSPAFSADVLAKSLKLLLSVLTPEQRAEWKEQNQVTIKSQSGRRYVLLGDRPSGNIRLLGQGESEGIAESLCCHPLERLPMPDVVVAQILHLRHDEEEFRRIANIRTYRLPEPQAA